MFNFDEELNRKNTSSVKYEEMEQKFGRGDLLPFWVADMDFKSPDFVIDTIKDRASHGVFGYTKRMPDYYKSIKDWLYRRHNFEVEISDIEYGPGVVFLLNMMVKNFTKEKEKIIIQTPVYYPFFSIIKENNRIVSENQLILQDGRYIIDYKDLEKKASDPECTMLILCSPHNPVGRVWEKEELEKIGDICIRNNVLIISDEIHFDLVYYGKKHIPFSSISEEFKEHSIICTAPSKTFNIAGLHSAYCIISDKDKMQKYRSQLGLMDLNRSNVFSREVTQAVYEKGDIWLADLIKYLSKNREFCIDYINNNIGGITALENEATYLLWIDCRELKLNEKELEDLFINKAKLALDSGNWFGENGKGFMRLNYACSKEKLKEGLERLKEAIEVYRK